MTYQLSLPGCLPTRPETVKDAVTAYSRNPMFWRDQVSFDFYSTLKNLLDKNMKEISSPLNINWYIHTLSTADRMMSDADQAISLLSDNSADGLISVLEMNLIKNKDKYMRNRTNIRVISVNETNPDRFNKYGLLVQSTEASLAHSSKGINPFLSCYSTGFRGGLHSLEINIPATQLPKLIPEQTSANFYAHGWYAKMHQELFERYWKRLNNIPEPEERKSLWNRAIEKILGLNKN